MPRTKTKYVEARCRVCGCTQDDACEEGCEWVDFDLCSSCQPRERISGRITYYDVPIAIGESVFDCTFSRPQLLKVFNESQTKMSESDVRISMVYRGRVKK